MTEPVQYERRKRDQRHISWLFLLICLFFAINCAVLFIPPLHVGTKLHIALVVLLVGVGLQDRRGITKSQMIDLLAIATVVLGISLFFIVHTARIVLMGPLFLLLLLATLGGIYFTRIRKRQFTPRSES